MSYNKVTTESKERRRLGDQGPSAWSMSTNTTFEFSEPSLLSVTDQLKKAIGKKVMSNVIIESISTKF